MRQSRKGPIVASKKRNSARAKGKFANGARPRRGAARAAAHDRIAHGAILQSVGEAAYEWRIDTDTLTWGVNAAQVLGIRDMALIANGRAYANLLDPGNAQTRFDAVMNSKVTDEGKGVPYQVEYCLRAAPRSDKHWIEDTGRWFAGPDGRPRQAHGVIRCISARHAREQELAYLSQFDSLTGEINRWHLAKILEKTLQDSIRARQSCGFLLVAVDNLARINESYGYDVADEVIGAVAKRLRTKMRAGDCIGRFSGNKFGVVLRNCSPEEIVVAADRFLAGIRDDIVMTAVGPVAVTATMGGVVAPRHARSVHEILSRAQETLNRAKTKRPGSFFAYAPNIEREALRQENVRSTDKIVTALNERRILLAYEPVVDTKNRETAFYECLMRIQRTDGSLVEANEIIPIAERLGLVRLLDHRVLELAIAELAASPDIRASLNVSPASTADPDWWTQLGALLRNHPDVAQRLIVEITEMAAIHDIDDTRGFVTRVKDLGCRIAIDDFGAGYTSFRNLRKLGVDIVKIDGAFVQNLTRSEDDRAFVRTLIELGRRLRIETVAEWVQDEEAAAMLTAWGCHYLQGALIGRATVDRPWADAPASHAAPVISA
jgi:diguanylate cyclase (GGDEF)-like protein